MTAVIKAFPVLQDEIKEPPHSIEAEQEVLGSLLVEPSVLPEVARLLKPGDFYRKTHQFLYESILELHRDKAPIDIVSVSQRLKDKQKLELVGGRNYVIELVAAVANPAGVIYQANIIRERAEARRLHSFGQQLVSRVDEGCDPEDLKREAIEFLNRRRKRPSELKPASEYADSVMQKARLRAELARDDLHYVPGIRTGYPQLDHHILGLNGGELIGIGGRAGMGKTVLGLCLTANVALWRRQRVVYFSLEMSGEALMRRLVARQTWFLGSAGRVSHRSLRTGHINEQGLACAQAAANRIRRAPITIVDDTTDACRTIGQIEAWARHCAEEETRPAVIVIDHFHLIQHEDKKMDRQAQLEDISARLKRLSKQLDIPVVILLQLSRAPESTKDHRPRLDHLRQSGAIEQDCDVVILLYRPEYYQREDTQEIDRGKIELILAKNREGEMATIRLGFDGAWSQMIPLVEGTETIDQIPEIVEERALLMGQQPYHIIRDEEGISFQSMDKLRSLRVWSREVMLERINRAMSEGNLEDFMDRLMEWACNQPTELERAWAMCCWNEMSVIIDEVRPKKKVSRFKQGVRADA